MDTLVLILIIILLGLITADVVAHFFVKKDSILSNAVAPIWNFAKVALFVLTFYMLTIILVLEAFNIL